MKAKRQFSWYNYNKILSYNAVYNFIMGGRGLGKTYGAKKLIISNFVKTGEEFVYVRRYKDELTAGKNTFFADIAHEFPDYDFRVNGDVAEAALASTREDKKRPWVTMGYFVALSTSQQRKGTSYPKVTWILFDEFIIEKGAVRYLPDESTVFTNFFSTVDRYQDKTRVLFLANAVSIMNPYFIEYNIFPDEVGEYSSHHGGFIAAHFADSSQFNSEIYQTRFGKFIKGKSYAEYAVESHFADAHQELLASKTPDAKYAYTIETKNGTFSVWIDYPLGQPLYYVQEKRPGQEDIYTTVPEWMREGVTLLARGSSRLQILRSRFMRAQIVFDKPKSRNAFIRIFER